MISWLKSLLTTVKKPAKIVKIWRVDPNRTDTTDELYEYLTGKKKTEKTTLKKQAPSSKLQALLSVEEV